MANQMKSLGTSHETAIKNWLRQNGWPYADRRTLSGANDEGDLRLSERVPFTIEAKTSKATTDKASLGAFMKELVAEVENSNSESGAVILKKRGTTDVGEYYAILPVWMLNVLLQRAYGE